MRWIRTTRGPAVYAERAAYSTCALAADGRLSLDNDVRKYIPELPEDDEPITLRQLLQHTSGIRDYIGIMYMAGARFADMDGRIAGFTVSMGRARNIEFVRRGP